MSSSPNSASSRNGAPDALASAAGAAGQNNGSGQNTNFAGRLPEEYALFVIDLLVKAERPLAKHSDKVMPIEPLRKVFDCLGGLDEIVVTYNSSRLRAKLRCQIVAVRGLIERIVDLAPAAIAEEGASELTEEAGADGGAGNMDLRSYVEQRLSPLLEELERTLADAEEFPEFVSPDIERVRRTQQMLKKSHQEFREDCERRMAEAEAKKERRAREEAEAEEQARLDAQREQEREQERDDLIATLVATVAELRADLDSVKRELAEVRARGGGDREE